MLNGLMMAASGLKVTVAYQAVASGQNSVTWPTVAANDIAVFCDNARDTGTISSNGLPSGFTLIEDTGADTARGVWSYKVCTGSESGSLTGMADYTVNTKLLYIFRPNIPAAVTLVDWDSEQTSGNPASQTITISGQKPAVIVLGSAFCSSGSGVFSTESPAFDGTTSVGSGGAMKVGYKVYNASPANHTIDMADLGTRNILMGGAIRLTAS